MRDTMIKDVVNKSYKIDFNGLFCSVNCRGLDEHYSYCVVFETDIDFQNDLVTVKYQRCESCINKWGKDE